MRVAGIRISSFEAYKPFRNGIVCACAAFWLRDRLAGDSTWWHRLRRWSPPLASCAAAISVLLAIRFGIFVAGGSDAYGYVSQAALWAAGNLIVPEPLAPIGRALGIITAPLGYRPAIVAGASVPTYAPGYPMLMALACEAGLEVVDGSWVRDDPGEIAGVLMALSGTCDLVVTTGGASVGEEDHSAGAVALTGGRFETLRIALKPGKPAVVGRIGPAVYLGLPGNPVSALVSWLIVGGAVVTGGTVVCERAGDTARSDNSDVVIIQRADIPTSGEEIGGREYRKARNPRQCVRGVPALHLRPAGESA